MPLIKGKSKKAFEHNLKAELHAGKPKDQSLAIAYSMAKKHKAYGGEMMAEGGTLTNDGYQSHCDEHCAVPCTVHPMAEPMEAAMPATPESSVGPGSTLNQREHEENQGDMNSENPRVMRIMMGRKQGYSEGGRVANQDHGPMDSRLAGFEQNEFDDLSLRDDLEFSYTGKNSGDERADAVEDKDRKDIVSRIMRSRAKKDRMPNPA